MSHCEEPYIPLKCMAIYVLLKHVLNLHHWLEYLHNIVSSLCKQNGLNLLIMEMQWSNSSSFSLSSLPPPHHHNPSFFLSDSPRPPPSLSFNLSPSLSCYCPFFIFSSSRFSLFLSLFSSFAVFPRFLSPS